VTRSLFLFTALLLPLALAAPAAAQPALFEPADDARASLAPRQAALLAHLEGDPTTAEVRLAEARLDRLGAPAVRFDLLPGANAVLALDRVERRGVDDATYFLDGADDGTFAILVLRRGQLTGSIRVEGRLFAVRPLTGGLHAVALVDEGRFADHGPEWAAVEAEAARRWAAGDPLAELAAPAAPEGGPIYQRVLVPYTPNAESQVADILALVQLAIDETNEGYDRSDVAHRVVLAHTYRTTQNESSFSTTLQRMANPADGWFDEIPDLRAEHGADLVNMIAGSAGGLCGQAFTILADGPDEGFSITAQNCATGYYSFGHELGHLQGARHNPEVDGSSSPFPYGHGKYYVAGGWRTVMSYACPGNCTRVLQWSNPDVLYNGEPTGDTTLRDNARVLDETAATVAAFYPDPTVGTATVAVERLSPGTMGPGGGPMRFRVTVSNASGAPFAGEGWVTATLPDGTDYGTIFGPRAVALDDGDALTRTLTVRVPAAAPAGTYTITAFAGAAYPDGADDSDAFTFTKEAGALAGTPAGGEPTTAAWTVTEDAETAGAGTVDAASATPDGPAAALTLVGTAPNPVRGAAVVRYAVGAAGTVRVAVYDVLGREAAVLADGPHAPGLHEATLDARGLPAGVYVVRAAAGTAVAAQRVTLLQ